MGNTTASETELPLRDIHLPEPISWWPPAPGWWILLATLILLALVFYFGRKIYRRRALKRAVAGELEKIKQDYHQNRDQHVLIQSLSVLLRRSAISFFPRRETASLTGEAWLRFLDESAPSVSSSSDTFYKGIGEVLASAPYKSESSSEKIDAESLLTLCESWLLAQSVSKTRQDN